MNLGTATPLPLAQVAGSPYTVTGTIDQLEMDIDPTSHVYIMQSRRQVGNGAGALEVENQVPTKKEIGAKIEHQRR